MNILKLILLALSLKFFICCQVKKNDNPEDYVALDETVNEIKTDSVCIEQLTEKPIKDFSEITTNELETLIESSRIGRIVVFRSDNVLDISSDRSLTYKIIGSNNSVKGIQERYRNIFLIEDLEIKSDMFDEPQKVRKFIYKESNIKTYLNPVTGKIDIVSGDIKDPEIILAEDIHVGITKDDFFSKIFKDANRYDFSIVDTLCNGDEAGEIFQHFIFSADTLKQVTLKSAYDWIPFDL